VEPLKICLISTPMIVTPPQNYGGLEMVVYDLAAGLAELGHEVTMIGAIGSKAPVGVKLIETIPPAGTVHTDWNALEAQAYEVYKGKLAGFDVIHDHTWFAHAYLYKRDHLEAKVMHTHHGGLAWKTRPFEKMNLVAISDWMMKVYGSQGWVSRRAYNGVDPDRYLFRAEKGERLLFVGRLDTFKQPDVAIAAAKRLEMTIDIVGGSFVQGAEFLAGIKALCDGDKVKMHLDASQDEKVELYRNARAVLFPSRMGEPFGLIVPESLLCGTPVIGLRDGAIPETLGWGGGYVVGEETTNLTDPQAILARKQRDVEALVTGVKRLQDHPIPPETCRKEGEKFTRLEMAKAYTSLYRDCVEGREW
jgi:glycosyltransferase involved in cell wall biosynthesis